MQKSTACRITVQRSKCMLLGLLRNYSNLFNLYNVAELFSDRVLLRKKKKYALICIHVLHKTQNLVISCFLRGLQRNVPKCVMHTCAVNYFANLTFS